MSEQVAVATCIDCDTPLDENWNVCPQCGTSAAASSGDGKKGDVASAQGRPTFSIMDGAPLAAFATGPRCHLGEGEKLGKQYMVVKALGAGGFGEVYQVRDSAIDRDIALKVVVVDRHRTKIAETQILQEFRIREKINDSRYIIKGYDPRPYQHKGLSLLLLPMELADGGSLRDWLAQNRDEGRRREEGVELFRQACLGVEAIHEAETGAVHLDIKPENILIAGGTAKVSDFGIGRFSGVNFEDNPDQLVRGRMGTPKYMSPEQFRVNRQKDIGTASDIYSLGIVLYEILDGRPPFDGSREELEDKHRSDLPTPLTGPAEKWWTIVSRCLRKRPADRYQTVALVLEDMKRVAQGVATTVDVSCPECEHINGNEIRRECENCGADVSMHFRECPQCSRPNRLDVQMCNGCGFAVAEHFLHADRRQRVSQLKDVDPVAAIELLETMIRHNPADEEKTLVKDLRQKLLQAKGPMDEARRAVDAGETARSIDGWRKVLAVFPRHKAATEQIREQESLLDSLNTRRSQAQELMDLACFGEADGLLQECLELVPSCQSVKRELDTSRTRHQRYASAFAQATEAHRERMLVRASESVSAALTYAPKSREAHALQAEMDVRMKQAASLLQQTEEQVSTACFDIAEQGLREIDGLQSDLGGVDVVRGAIVQRRGAYEQAMEMSRHAIRDGDLTKALVNVNDALQACPDSLGAKAFQKDVRENQDEAERLVRSAVAALPIAAFEHAANELRQAETLWAMSDTLASAKVDLAKTRERYATHMKLAEAARSGKDLDKADTEGKRALKLCSGSAEAKTLLKAIADEKEKAQGLVEHALSIISAARFDEAAADLEQAEQLWSTFGGPSKARKILAKAERTYTAAMEKARDSRAEGDLDTAVSTARSAHLTCQVSTEPRIFLDSVWEVQTKAEGLVAEAQKEISAAQFEAAVAKLRCAEDLWPRMDTLVAVRVDVIEIQREYERCITRAKTVVGEGNLSEAMTALENALRACPKAKEAKDLKRKVKRSQGEARANVTEAMDFLPQALFDEAEDRLRRAEAVWQSFDSLDETKSALTQSREAYETAIGVVLSSRAGGDLAAAQQAALSALATCSDSPEARGFLESVEEDQQKVQSLLKEARKAASGAEFKDVDASLCRAEGLWERWEALIKTRTALTAIQETYETCMTQARAAMTEGNLDEAVVALENAQRACPGAKEAEDLKRDVDKGQAQARAIVKEALGVIPQALFDEAEDRLRRAEAIWRNFECLNEARAGLGVSRESFDSRMELARKALAEKDLDAAIQAAQIALDVCPESHEAHNLIDSANKDRATALSHLKNAGNLLTSAQFHEARKEVERAKSLWHKSGREERVDLKVASIERDYGEAMEQAKEALGRGDFPGALDACVRAHKLCPESQSPPRLKARIETEREQAFERRRRKEERKAGCVRWGVTTVPLVVGLSLLIATDATLGGAAAGVAVGASLLNRLVNTKLYGKIRDWGFVQTDLQAFLGLLGLLLLIPGIGVAAMRSTLQDGSGATALLATGSSYLAIPLVAVGHALFALRGGRAVARVLGLIVMFGGVAAVLAIGATWLWGWISESVWPMCQSNSNVLLYISGGALLTSVVALAVCAGLTHSQDPSANGVMRVVLILLFYLGIGTALVCGLIWVYGWATGSFWPWCKVHQLHLICVLGGLIVVQAFVHMIRDTHMCTVWGLGGLFLIPLLSAGLIVGISALLAVFVLSVPGVSGSAAGLLATSFLGLGAAMFACISD